MKYHKLFNVKVLIFVFFFLITIFPPGHGQVVINEFMAANNSSHLTPKSKKYADWIELYNAGNEQVDLGGWYLTDDLKEKKWEIPFFVTLKPKQYIVFWADGEDKNLHTNFKLKKEGEEIGLFNAQGELVDSIKYDKQQPDVSYGRGLKNTEKWMFFNHSTPDAPNNSEGFRGGVRSPVPQFSKPSGFYSKKQTIKLNSTIPGAVIHYTLDGSIPDENSAIYNKEITLNKTTVLRARTYTNLYLTSPVATHTYFINESSNFAVISLSSDKENLWNKDYGIYTSGNNFIDKKKWKTANFFQDWERPVHIEYFDENGKPCFSQDAGMRIYGKSTRLFAQKSLALFARDNYGPKKFDYPLFENKNIQSCKSFVLRNSGNDWGSTMFLDAMVQSLVQKRMDIDIQGYRPAIVFINGKFWGIHNIREKVNEHYLADNYNIDKDEVDIIHPVAEKSCYEAVEGDRKDWNKLIDFAKNNDLANPDNYQAIKEMMDINEFINYNILEIYCANTDWPAFNLKAWKPRIEQGKWRWAVYDLDISFGMLTMHDTVNTLTHALGYKHGHRGNPEWATLLFRELIKNNHFKNEFIQRFAAHMNTTFHPERVHPVIDSFEKRYRPEFPRHIERWGGYKQDVFPWRKTAASMGEWGYNIDYLRKFTDNRPKKATQHFIDEFDLQGTSALKLKMNKPEAGFILINGVKVQSGNFQGDFFRDIPLTVEAVPSHGYRFTGWKDGKKSAERTLKMNKNTKLIAEFEPLPDGQETTLIDKVLKK